jgi:hypothetical protein
LGERKNGIERKMIAMTDLCTQLWSNLFFIGDFFLKNEIKYKKSKIKFFWRFLVVTSLKIKIKIIKFQYLICNVQEKILKSCLKICTTYLVNSQIRLNLPMDDHHYFYNDSQFGSQKQILTKTPV